MTIRFSLLMIAVVLCSRGRSNSQSLRRTPVTALTCTRIQTAGPSFSTSGSPGGPGLNGTFPQPAGDTISEPACIHAPTISIHRIDNASFLAAATQPSQSLDPDLADSVISIIREERQHLHTLFTRFGGAVGGLGGILLLVQLFNALWDARQRLRGKHEVDQRERHQEDNDNHDMTS